MKTPTPEKMWEVWNTVREEVGRGHIGIMPTLHDDVDRTFRRIHALCGEKDETVSSQPEKTEVEVEPTQEAVDAFNREQMIRREAWVAGASRYKSIETLPRIGEEARKAYPLKRLVKPLGYVTVGDIQITVQNEHKADGSYGRADRVWFNRAGWADVFPAREHLLAALALLDEKPRVEDVPPNEETP